MGGHPPNSPVLSPCDYTIFGPLKMALRGKRVTLDNDIKQYVRNWFTTQPRKFTTLCRSGTSASTARANTSDIQVLASVPRPSACFFLNAPLIIFHLIETRTVEVGIIGISQPNTGTLNHHSTKWVFTRPMHLVFTVTKWKIAYHVASVVYISKYCYRDLKRMILYD